MLVDTLKLLYKITINIKIIAHVILLNYVICYRSHAGTCLQHILSFWYIFYYYFMALLPQTQVNFPE